MKTLDELREAVAADPAAPEFLELAGRLLELPDKRHEAREVCFQGLAKEPRNGRARLLLARSFYLDHMPEFCVRELLELERYTDSPALRRLLDTFGEYATNFRTRPEAAAESASTEEETVGEVDLDADFDEVEDEVE